MSIDEVLGEQREEILRIAAKHGARNVRVFGSVARGDAGPQSDIDFLIDVGPETTPWFPAGLIIDLEALLGRSVDVAMDGALHEYLRDRISAEAVPL